MEKSVVMLLLELWLTQIDEHMALTNHGIDS